MALVDERKAEARKRANEATVQSKIDFLADIRRELDTGALTVKDFIDISKPLAERVNRDLFQIAGSGSRGADMARSLLQQFQDTSGFAQDSVDPRNITVSLPDSFQERVREELIPDNITGEEREALLKEIPFDIGFDTDRFESIREGIRQREQQEEQVEEFTGLRQQRLGDLADLLKQQSDRQFNMDAFDIGEEAQAAGIFNTSGLADALSKRRLDLERQTGLQLAQQGLTDRDAEILGLQGALQRGQEFQTAGLQREFSLDDFRRQAQLARELGAAATPSISSSGSGKASSTLAGAGTGAGIGTAIAPGIGTAIGAGVGAGVGALSNKGK